MVTITMMMVMLFSRPSRPLPWQRAEAAPGISLLSIIAFAIELQIIWTATCCWILTTSMGLRSRGVLASPGAAQRDRQYLITRDRTSPAHKPFLPASTTPSFPHCLGKKNTQNMIQEDMGALWEISPTGKAINTECDRVREGDCCKGGGHVGCPIIQLNKLI